MPVFIDDLIPDFYEPVGPSFRQGLIRGQFGWTFIAYATENLELWRPKSYDASRTSATAFHITAAGQDAFARAAPLHTPPLRTDEEFVVVKAKPRPVIIISPSPPRPEIRDLRRGARIHRRMALVLPVFGLLDRITGQLKYPDVFVERIRILEYPQYFYLPATPRILRTHSYARLSEMRAVHEAHIDPVDLRLRDEVRQILEGQLQYLVDGIGGEQFLTYREQLLHQEPGQGRTS